MMLTHIGTKTIETERLLLRRFRKEDAVPMFNNWANDPEVTKYLTWPAHKSVEETKMVIDGWIADQEKDDHYLWAIALRDEESQPIGSISVVDHDDRVGKFHIGYCIGKQWWHQGIMTEALGAVMRFLFQEVGAQRIEAAHDPRNPHSGAVMRKCGMTFEGTLRRSDWNNQGICDTCIYAAFLDDAVRYLPNARIDVSIRSK